MKTVSGVFTSLEQSQRAVADLRATGIAGDNISILTPGTSREEELRDVPTTEGEQPGMGNAVGGVVGAALGTAGGASVGMAAASVLVPGVGPVIALGLTAATIMGIGGAIGGATVGGALENALTEGLPKDEIFVYEDALRQGRSIVIALVEGDDDAQKAHAALEKNGAESIDAAREHWWVGLRSAEEEEYAATGGDFKTDEQDYRSGFEAAQQLQTRGKPYAEVTEHLRRSYPKIHATNAFRRGYERGQAYYRSFGGNGSKDR